ncbi:hypothetical protein BH11VER1_BH11VER1_23220 [soil metagenome]
MLFVFLHPQGNAFFDGAFTNAFVIGGNEGDEEIGSGFDILLHDKFRSDVVVVVHVMVVAQWHADPGAADPAGLKRGGFTGTGIEKGALNADPLLGSGAHENRNEVVIKHGKAVADTNHGAIAHFRTVHRTARLNREEAALFTKGPIFTNMPGAEESDFFGPGECRMNRGVETETGEFAQDIDDNRTSDEVITGSRFNLAVFKRDRESPGSKLSQILAQRDVLFEFGDGLGHATEKFQITVFAGNLDPGRMIHVSSEHPNRCGFVFALAIGGQQVAERVGGQFDVRNVEEELLNLRAHMIFMKWRCGLIEKLLEDRGQRVSHADTVNTFFLLPTPNVKKIRYLLETAVLRAAVRFLPGFSRPVLLFLSKAAGAIAYLADYRGRTTAHENLRVAFAKENITPRQIRGIALASYQTFARTFLDLFWSLSLTKENYKEHVLIDFEDPSSERNAHETGALWVTPHFGNFEMVSLAIGFRGVRFTVVAQDFKNPALTELFTRLRRGSGHVIIPQEGAMLRLMKDLKRKGHAGLLTDLNIRPNRTATVIECFGLKTCATMLHTSLSMRLGLPVFTGLCFPLEDGRYRLELSPPLNPKDFSTTEEFTQVIWNRFEEDIRKTPEAWLWMYKHWRYLPGNQDDARYPKYSNPNRAFEAMVRSCG